MFICRYGMDSRILANFYRCTIESILTGNFTAWYGNTTAQDRRALQRVIKSAQRLITSELPNIHSLYNQRCLRKAKRIVLDPHHPSYTHFTLLPSGRRYRCMRAHTSRLGTASFLKPSGYLTPNRHRQWIMDNQSLF